MGLKSLVVLTGVPSPAALPPVQPAEPVPVNPAPGQTREAGLARRPIQVRTHREPSSAASGHRSTRRALVSTDELTPAPLEPQEARGLAHRYGLQQVGVRPPLLRYLRDTWKCRGFVYTLSSGRTTARNSDNYFGQAWSLLNPAFNILVYFFIFGLLLSSTRQGIHNFIGYLSVGVVGFQMLGGMMTKGSTSIVGNPSLVRALRFPRCVMPLSVVLTEFFAALPAFVLVLVVMLITGERPTLWWLLYPVAIAINVLIGAGAALIVARLVNSARDLANLIAIVIRLLRYVSGVFFATQTLTTRSHFVAEHTWIGNALTYQPFSIALTTLRETLLKESPPQLLVWVVAIASAIVIPAVGMVFFWRAEEAYGRG